MKLSRMAGHLLCGWCVSVSLPAPGHSAERDPGALDTIVAQTVAPLMKKYDVPGMAVGVVVDGHGAVFNFGLESKATGKHVDDQTLFELGSVSKTFTATLAAYSAVTGHLSLDDKASADYPSLKGSAFDDVSLLDLGTHTPGGMPLQLPDEVTTEADMMLFFRNWKPTYAPGTVRTYANPSIGLLGLIAARSMHAPFEELEERTLFQPLGLTHSHLSVPSSEFDHYAQGYTNKDVPTQMSPGMLAAEAYGIRTTAADTMRFVEANMGLVDLPQDLRRAISLTHTGYFKVGAMTQDLIWEQYRYPVTLQELQWGNSARISYEANSAVRLDPPLPPQADVIIDKTGSTNGFAAYVAFVPGRKIGVVLLANKNYPIEARVDVAYAILARIDEVAVQKP